VEVEVTRVDAEPFGELAVGQRLAAPEGLEDPEAKWMPQRLQLLGAVDRQDVVQSPSLPQGYVYRLSDGRAAPARRPPPGPRRASSFRAASG
jgi:hypothetical protein